MDPLVVLAKAATIFSPWRIWCIANVIKHFGHIGVQRQFAHIPGDARLVLLRNFNQIQIVRDAELNRGIIQKELSSFVVPAGIAFHLDVAMTAAFPEIIKIREIEEGREIICVHSIFNDHRLISKNKLPDLRGAGALQARHGQRLVADHVLRSQAQALVGSPGAQQAAGQTSRRVPLLLQAPCSDESPRPRGLLQGRLALQIQQELFDFDATAIPSGSVDAIQEIFRFHLLDDVLQGAHSQQHQRLVG
mmetsp:Transcript_38221/g.82431  ORF Transcript_38221/g.82431 Transcript_38221/m.82431 type:complete len:248 (+) Transcript_38221:737-1480(+)